ncbi:MAG: CbiX/SirB N-terminal domain-containing protein [Nitrospirota bacterium]
MKTAILLLGHGSSLEDANESLHGVVRMIKAVNDCYIVEAAFLTLARPSISEGIESCIGKGAERIVVIPYFIYMGTHVKEDIPNEINAAKKKHPEIEIIIGNHLGVHRKLIEIVLERVEEMK